jgi:triacylglycerol lipase
MPDIYRYFRRTYERHSKTNAFLLALPSYFIYPASVTWRGGMWQQFEALFNDLSEEDPFTVEPFTRERPGIDIQAAAMVNSRLILVVFRGSEQKLADWLGTNANHAWRSVPTSWGAGLRVHSGFYTSLREIYHDLRAYIRERDNSRRVFLAGHSLGGALAILCGYRFQKVGGIAVQGVYSWGAPRVGNDDWASHFNTLMQGRCYRWVKGADFGAGLPDVNVVPGIGRSYFHVGELNYIHQDGSVQLNLPDFDAAGPTRFHDHNMKRYLQKMMSELSNRERRAPNDPAYLVEKDATQLVVPGRERPLTALIAAGE